mmetsp:Transcript_24838/g.28719  ORF Transcript_24838/g.28719 Transcript_24838/m.28719 type:complete len:441 (-) Transcript_24838:29-1351(-)
MTVISTATATLLLPILQRAFPDVKSYEVKNNIVQANAEGFCIEISGEHNSNNKLFVKCVEASKYAHKPWGDLRRTLLYSRTEARFYSDILPLLKENSSSSWKIAPDCYLAESVLHDLIGEEESAAAKVVTGDGQDHEPKYDTSEKSVLENKGGNLILESIQGNYYQTSPLSITEASQCLATIAKFHATAFGNQEILHKVSTKLCEYGGSYHLKNRNPKELENICHTWDAFLGNIQEAAPADFFTRENIRNLGQRIGNIAHYISDELSPAHKDEFATIVHGDFKAMNIFIPLRDSDNDGDGITKPEPLLIDFASAGVGNGLSDVAMHITHAVVPSDLANGGEEKLVEYYLSELRNALPPSQKDLYPKTVAMRHYRLATVDYFRFVLGRLWKGVTLESFEKRKDSKNAVLVNRSVEAALAFIQRVDKYTEIIENELKIKEEP